MKLVILLGGILFLAACQQQGGDSLLQEKPKNTDTKMQYVTNSDPVEPEKKTTQETARHLAKLAVEVPDVHDATSVVVGNYAVVGIDVDKDLDRSRVGVIKYSVAEALKDDPDGRNALIVADADGVERIRDLGEKMSEGHPVEGITDELSQIIARYLPEGPIREVPTDDDQSKESVPDEDQQDMDEIQKEQSSDQ
ncbi:putative lipoprotein YlaJ [Halobacillus andaensis]|uniref:Lipoprotein YlaJ n=1 Tax=Halobacillus andaensis TaxID=1176239 RepID=A0A917B0K1_HALAA|nr:YhcN/YlaJ family sporulation lipoprotein [Halobacillus andaensis]MBP2003628.1 YhcN/YlaJ family sporulation lipoprotein [Halobacillus andaensis]GGF12065.1 putative lipoprotein YlaJ [Halobacillus andaensis]